MVKVPLLLLVAFVEEKLFPSKKALLQAYPSQPACIKPLCLHDFFFVYVRYKQCCVLNFHIVPILTISATPGMQRSQQKTAFNL